jgi:MFS family permease
MPYATNSLTTTAVVPHEDGQAVLTPDLAIGPHSAARVPRSVWPARFLAISTLFYWAAMYVYVPILPVYAQSFGASLGVVGLVVSAYGFSQLVLRIPIGVASDRFGWRKPFCIAGCLVGSLSCVSLLLAPSAGWLVVGRGIAGMSASFWVVIAVAFSDYFDPKQATRAMAQLTALSGLAQLVSTLTGGWLADAVGPSAPFVLGIGFGLIGAALLWGVPETRKVRVSTPSWSRMFKVGTSSAVLKIGIVAAMLQFASWATTYTFVPLYAHSLGASSTILGILTTGALVPYTMAAFGVSRWASLNRARSLAIAGLVLCAVVTAMAPAIQNVTLLGLSQALGGLGRGITLPILMGLSIAKVAPEEKATAMGVFQAVYAVGMFLGPASAGLVAQAVGLGGAFVLSALICLVGAMILSVPSASGHSLE